MKKRKCKIGSFKVSIAIFFAIPIALSIPLYAYSLPQGGSAVDNSATINQTNAITLNVNQTQENAVVNWNSFSVGSNEKVNFNQPSSNSSILNRVTGNDPSNILGQINANGKVYLINPNGIMFGREAKINTNSFFGSTVNITDENFRKSVKEFSISPNSTAKITNQGEINTDGYAVLLSPSVDNQGIITAKGQVSLISANKISFDEGNVSFNVDETVSQSLKTPLVSNTGNINSNKIIISAQQADAIVNSAINLEGIIKATSISEKDGKIIVDAGSGYVSSTGKLDASGDNSTNGGNISVNGGFVSLGGTIDASGKDGGSINISSANTLSLSDTIKANGLNGNGGSININSGSSLELCSSNISANGINGGIINHYGENQILTSGNYSAVGTNNGGDILLSSNTLSLISPQINVSGGVNGGTVLLGGSGHLDISDKPYTINNAEHLYMTSGTKVVADGGTQGGNIVSWSQGDSIVLGKLYARNKGFIETSSGNTLSFNGDIETNGGTFLFDPKNINIVSDSDISSINYSLMLGIGYDVDTSTNSGILESNDNLGRSVSLDGTMLAVGAYKDDGFNNTATDSGAVYLFQYNDLSFNGGTLKGIIGYGYTGTGNVDISNVSGQYNSGRNLESGDHFGTSIAIKDNILAVGANNDSGLNNAATNSGSVYLFNVSKDAGGNYTGASFGGLIGYGYTGGNNLNIANIAGQENQGNNLESGDVFGLSLSFNGSKLSVGATYDDGYKNTATDSGAVYVFNVTKDSNGYYTGTTFDRIIGKGYSGGSNINLANLDAGDNFGWSTAIYGNRLAVGAIYDDGYNNAQGSTNYGAVYLFNLDNNSYNTIGKGYTDIGNVNLSALSTSNQFGYSLAMDGTRLVMGTSNTDLLYAFNANDLTITPKTFSGMYPSALALDGNRMALGYTYDPGYKGCLSSAGSVKLYDITHILDSTPSLSLIGTVGVGYAGSKDINISGKNHSGDGFGRSVALDGTLLAVGAYQSDGAALNSSNAGSVYIFQYNDISLNGGSLKGIIGNGYTGSGNIDISKVLGQENSGRNLEAGDNFGTSVALKDNILAVGANNDGGLNNAATNSGSVYLFNISKDAAGNYTGSSFGGLIGYGYTGGNNFDLKYSSSLQNSGKNLEVGDYFGTSLSFDGSKLAVGAYGDDGYNNTASGSGAVYLFNVSKDANGYYTGATFDRIIGKGYSGGNNLDVANLEGGAYGQGGDSLGYSSALYGNKLAVGASSDDGYSNTQNAAGFANNYGAVYLFDLNSNKYQIIGKGYTNTGTGSGDINLSDLSSNNQFGYSLAMDSTRLIVGSPNISKLYVFNPNDLTVAPKTVTGFYSPSLSISGNNLAVGISYDNGYNGALSASGAVKLYDISHITDANPSMSMISTIGYGYTGGKNIDTSISDAGNGYGSSVSLNGNYLAVGAQYKESLDMSGAHTGAVYIYQFNDADFNGAVLKNVIGRGYTGTGQINLSLDPEDNFGSSVALNGTNLAVGASGDDGYSNVVSNSGAVYLFQYNSDFSSGVLKGIIGNGYTGTGNYNLSSLEANDNFGASVALNGTQLAAGATGDGGSSNIALNSGAVYLFNNIFSSASLSGTIGKGYTGTSDINILSLESGDNFGSSVALYNNRLAVGATGDDGADNSTSNVGAVYIINLSDSSYTILGKGYSNNISGLSSGALFGSGIALDNTYLAVGVEGVNNGSGAVYLYNASNYSEVGEIGRGLSNNISTLEDGDGFGHSVSLDNGRLAIGAPGDDGKNNIAADSGSVYLFELTGADPANATFSKGNGNDYAITASKIDQILSSGNDVTLQANNDITLNTDLTANNLSGNGGILTLQAGKSIILNGNITTDNGNLSLIANDTVTDGVVNEQRGMGSAVISMATGKNIEAGSGTVSMLIKNDTSKSNHDTGDITLSNISAGNISVMNEGTTSGSDIIINGTLSSSNTGYSMQLETLNGVIQNSGNISTSGHLALYSDSLSGNTFGNIDTSSIKGRYGISTLSAGLSTITDNSKNYFITNNNPVLNISLSGNNIIYGDTPSLSAINPSGLLFGDTLNDAGISFSIIGSKNGNGYYNAGSYGINATSSLGYSINNGSSQLNVAKKELTITTVDKSKVYGDANPSFSTNSITNFVTGESQSVLGTYSINWGTDATVTSPVSTYSIHELSNTLPSNSNYSYHFVDGTLSITPKAIIVIGVDATKVYGDNNPAFSISTTGLVGNDTLTSLGVPTFLTNATKTSPVNSYYIRPSGLSNTNYNFSYQDGTLNITPASLTIRANNATRAYGDNNYFSVSYTGFVNGDTASSLSGSLSYLTTANNLSAIGDYSVTPLGLSSHNYNIAYQNGTLHINPSDLFVKVNDTTKFVGQPNPDFTTTITGFKNHDTLQDLSGSLLFTTSANVNSPAGRSVVSATGLLSSNYSIHFIDGNLSIISRSIALDPLVANILNTSHFPIPNTVGLQSDVPFKTIPTAQPINIPQSITIPNSVIDNSL